MSKKIVEYSEDTTRSLSSRANLNYGHDHNDMSHPNMDDLMVVYDELEGGSEESMGGEVSVKDVGEELSDLLKDDSLADMVKDFTTEYSEDISETVTVPGSDFSLSDEEPELEAPKDWLNDRNPDSFMDYIDTSYPGGIPQHDGQSMVGCERAILFLTRINKEISEALRLDSNDVLDPHLLEDYRVKIMRDIVTLKTRLSELKTKLNQSTRDKTSSLYNDSMVKEATTPRLQIVVTPFERAVAGILVNSVVSGGKPFEDVYSFLKNKYALDEREELSVMQILMDGGFHIFKDRGTFGSSDTKSEDESPKHGVEFIKNYFG